MSLYKGNNSDNTIKGDNSLNPPSPTNFKVNNSGGFFNDTIYGYGGNDTISGLNGNDTIYGGNGDDTLNGGAGNDTLKGEAGADILNGDAGNDTLYGGDGIDTLSGDAGNDTLYGDAGDDTLNGGDGNDALNGGTGNDALNGDAGNDTLNGGDGNDIISGGDGKDVLNGGRGNDKLTGGAGPDAYDVSAGSDTIVIGLNDSFVPSASKLPAASNYIDTIKGFKVGDDHLQLSAPIADNVGHTAGAATPHIKGFSITDGVLSLYKDAAGHQLFKIQNQGDLVEAALFGSKNAASLPADHFVALNGNGHSFVIDNNSGAGLTIIDLVGVNIQHLSAVLI